MRLGKIRQPQSSYPKSLLETMDAEPRVHVSNVTDMEGMFHKATSFNQPLNKWNVSNVESVNFGHISFFL